MAPENTLPAVRAALVSGFDYVEVDLALTADGVPVLMHDRTVNRTTDGTGPLAALTLAEVRRLDAVCHVLRIARTGGVVVAADSADARTDDETGLRVLAAKDDLEAAEHRRLGPGRGDDAVVDGDADVEVALDAAERADEQIH